MKSKVNKLKTIAIILLVVLYFISQPQVIDSNKLIDSYKEYSKTTDYRNADTEGFEEAVTNITNERKKLNNLWNELVEGVKNNEN